MSPPQENDLATRIGGIVSTLRARHLDRIAAGYAVTAWVVVQAASIVVPSFDVNSRAIRAVIIFFLLGFPVTLIGAWFAAPHVSPHASARHARRKPSKAAYAIFATFAAFFFIFNLLFAGIYSLQPEDIANLALFLAADDSRLITRQCISVNGGVL